MPTRHRTSTFFAMLAVALAWPGLGACTPSPDKAPAAASSAPNSANPTSANPTVDGLGLGLSRDDMAAAIRARAVTRETVRKFANGGEELRFRLADGTFIRLDFPDPDGDSRPRAIIVSAADAATPADALAALTGAFGPPTWKSRTGETVMWHARGGAEDIVTPDAGAPFVAELHTLPGQPPSYTLAKPSWYQPKGQ